MMLTRSGHGSVTALNKPNKTQTKDMSPQCARVVTRRITGSAALGKDQLDMGAACLCPQCDHYPAGSPESLMERHSVRCPNGGQRHYMHAGLVSVIVTIMLMAGVPNKSSIVLMEKNGVSGPVIILVLMEIQQWSIGLLWARQAPDGDCW